MEKPKLDSTFLIDFNMEKVGVRNFLRGQASFFSAKCPDSEKTANEDSGLLIPAGKDCGILVVADGLGGARSAQTASEIAINECKKSIMSMNGSDAQLRTAILDAFENANQKILQLGVGAATTLSVCEINGRTARPYHVGDSLILITGLMGKIKYQAVPHSPVGYAVESGIIDEDEAMEHDERHIVSNCLGSHEMKIEVGPLIELDEKDSLVVASDGLTDNLTIDEITETIRKGPLEEATQSLVDQCHQRMTGAQKTAFPTKPDDLTLITYRPN